jgi:hypothetical protein
MHPRKVARDRLRTLTDLPNVGEATAADLRLLGVQTPSQLLGKSAFAMYADLCALTGVRHDPCVIDVFLSVTRFMAGDDPRPWWAYTAERKQMLQQTNGNG